MLSFHFLEIQSKLSTLTLLLVHSYLLDLLKYTQMFSGLTEFQGLK